MDISFTGKRALVTGGGKGIGRDIAQRLVDFGAIVFVIDRLPENLANLKAQSPSITTFCVDITDWDLTRKTVADIGPLDLLVNNAGVLESAPFIEITKEQLYNVTSVNFFAAFNIAQVAAIGMIARGNGGAIVNVASTGSKRASETHSTYCCSKAAVAMLTKTMACELGRHNIRVNSVSPALVITDMTKEMFGDPDVQTALTAKMPLGRLTEKEDVVNTVMFLLSDKAPNITGSMIPIDGGFLGVLACSIGVGHMPCHLHNLPIVLLVLYCVFNALVFPGFLSNHAEFAGRYAGTAFGLGNAVGMVGGILAPLVVGWLTPNGTQEKMAVRVLHYW